MGLLDAYNAMISKADGDSTPLDIFGSRLRGGYLNHYSVLVMVYHRWKRGSLLLWRLRRLLPGLVGTSCMSWLQVSLSLLTLLIGPYWIALWVGLACLMGFAGLIFLLIVGFVLGLSLLRVLVNLGVGTLVFHRVVRLVWCSLSPMYVPWCRHLESMPDVKPQLYADNLECSAERPGTLFDSARFTALYVRSVGQDVSPGKCVLLSTSKSVRKAMKLCGTFSGDGPFWKVQLDVRDLGVHLDFTNRARAGTLSCRVKEATAGVAAVGALPLGFQVKLGWVRGQYIRAGLHAAEASYVSSSSICALRAAFVRAVWSSKMPLANAPAILNLLDGPVGVDPAFHIVWSRFHMMRRFLAYCP